jgi:hypothetical protein
VLLILGTNKQPSEPKHTNTERGNLHDLLSVLHRSDRWTELVRRGAATAAQQMFQRASVTSLGPGTRPPPKHNPSKTPPKLPRTDQHQHNPKTHELRNSSEANPTKGLHWSDRSRAPVRPVCPGQLGMNRTRGSTPPNPTLDLPIRSTDPYKTLRIVGTPHGHSIAKLWSTKPH